ncbi:hypothetical protein QR680_011074 [Steinernema hermaphroditum]|uniref:G-protein coupled receptors family 1 profile domain-containing protein n=1 Tax=Steinernema hermaphroditum TaxID=289476 RepID=A0AA39MCV0_9BILA|nr:hypothetical protein QR680_011074 [Steinernema hermaphroditum]
MTKLRDASMDKNMGLTSSNNSYNYDICEIGTVLSQDIILLICLGIKVALSIFGVIVLPIVLLREKLSSFFHKNAREIFRLHIWLVLVAAFGTIASDGFDLLRLTVFKWMSHDITCPVFPISSRIGLPLRLIKIFGMSGCAHAFLASAIERIYATIKAHTYEEVNNNIGKILSVVSLLATFAVMLVVWIFSESEVYMPMTVIPPGGIKYSLGSLYIDGGLEVLIVIIFGILFVLNCYRKKTSTHITHSLSFKFQTRENVATTALLFPLALLHAAFQLTTAVIMPTLLIGETDQVKRTRLVGVLDIIPLYNAALPLVMMWRIRAKRRKIEELFESNFIGRFSTGKDDADKMKSVHFEMLENMFK